MCNSGVGLTPIIDGELHHFSCGGLYDGLALLIDDETRTYWDHITGEAVHGPLLGKKMPMWGLEMSDFGALRQREPGLRLLQPKARLKGRIATWVMRKVQARGLFPPGFRATMRGPDSRLPEMELGLGVVGSRTRRFYPKTALTAPVEDELDGERLSLTIDADTGVPFAIGQDGERPVQLFCRWYGFAATYSGCEIYVPAGVSQTHGDS